eukprot:CAMPEP_0175946984 /NCGR_PEP_ID=MMETSP0108-20121206/27631_1 /TAXON_ID=195067 ORGANISM="Goniomonas pacifica, Strain CCMP1869" /NCGR_SAMPLE_ID=MMETSP0108 /ASSEMBLY_ACC=CAM_ASM_000204 /LENGTH=224 /DNA_ID=CAMNT_0017272559 /DNA_START=8 /DNA_END=682 /DNA_ORIENTATION=+
MNATTSNAAGTSASHALQHSWNLYYDLVTTDKKAKASSTEHDSGLHHLATITTIEEFWEVFNNLPKPTKLPEGGNFFLFKDGIKPTWEDAANAQGGRWFGQLNKKFKTADKAWTNLAVALVGELIAQPELVCGLAIGRRPGADRIAVWCREQGTTLEKTLKQNLGVPAKICWQLHNNKSKKKKSAKKAHAAEMGADDSSTVVSGASTPPFDPTWEQPEQLVAEH